MDSEDKVGLPEGFVLDEQASDSGLPEGFQMDEAPQVQTTKEAFPNTPDVIIGQIINPLVEINRGFAKGASSFYGSLDAVASLLEKTTGAKKGGLFEEWSKSTAAYAQSLPSTGMDVVNKTVFEAAGEAIPTITEFSMIKFPKFIGKVAQSLSEVGKFGVIGALQEYEKDKDPMSLVKGAAQGAATSMTFQGAGKSLEVFHKFGKKAAATYLSFVTGDRQAAKDFIRDPGKFNVNPFGARKTVPEIQKENELQKFALQEKVSNEKFVFTQNAKREQQMVQEKLRNSQEALRAQADEAKALLVSEKAAGMEEATRKATEAIELNDKALLSNATNTYDSALQKYLMIRKHDGEAVGSAVDATINRNPGAAIQYGTVMSRVNKTVQDMAPFAKKEVPIKSGLVGPGGGALTTGTKTGFAPRTKMNPNPQDLKTFKVLMRDLEARKSEGGFSVKYLQDLKKDLSNLSTKSYKAGDNRLGIMYDQLSRDVNPGKIVSENPELSSGLREIAEANRNFADMVPKYEAAMQYYFRKDASGNYIPDPMKAVNIIKRGDKALIQQMQKADLALPVEDRLFPKITELLSETSKAERQQLSIVSALKHKAKKDLRNLQVAAKQSMTNLQKNNRQLLRENREAVTNDIRTYTNAKSKELQEAVQRLSDLENHYKQQELLNRFTASPSTLAGLTQRLLGFGALLPAFKLGDPGMSGAAMAGMGALSPAVVANVSKGALKASGTADEILTPLLMQKNLQQVLGNRILTESGQ